MHLQIHCRTLLSYVGAQRDYNYKIDLMQLLVVRIYSLLKVVMGPVSLMISEQMVYNDNLL